MIELMTDLYISVCLAIFGAALGSYAAASVWRLRAAQLRADAATGETIATQDTAQVKRLAKTSRAGKYDRSVCLHCGRQLSWYDMIPIVSWLAVRGRCRTCKQPIGVMELWAEVLLGIAFVASYWVWPFEFTPLGVVLFVLWLIALVLLAIHWMYDAKWFLLLDKITLILVAVALLYAGLSLADLPNDQLFAALKGLSYTLAVLPGFYGLLHVISRGAWVGLGDVKLLVPFALMLPAWEHGVLLIFLANLIGCVVLMPLILRKKLARTTRVPFGPFLIVAFVVTFLFGQRILDAYFSLMLF